MPFIGVQPATIPLTSSDITDGIITGAKIENNPTIAGNLTVSGTANVTGVTTLADNIVFSASGKGIHLGVTSATASNLQDDYEEGNFTATLSASGATIGQSVSKGTYTKIGNQVNINIYVQCDGTVSLNSNALSITGLPFTAENTGQLIYYGCCGMRYITMSSNYDNLMSYINTNDNTVQIFQHGSGQSPIALPSSGLSNSSGQIFVQMFYYTS